MRHIATRLSILLSFIGVGAFGIGVFGAIAAGGLIGLCFVVALLSGTLAMGLDAVGRSRHRIATNHEAHYPTALRYHPTH